MAVGILLFLIIGGGIGYVYYNGLQTEKEAVAPAQTTDNKQTLPAVAVEGDNSPNGASVQYISSPVKAGENANIIVTTGQQAACTIAVAYNNVASRDTGLNTKTADIHGSISWTWTVDKNATPGKWPVKVTCTRNKKVGYVEGTLEVIK